MRSSATCAFAGVPSGAIILSRALCLFGPPSGPCAVRSVFYSVQSLQPSVRHEVLRVVTICVLLGAVTEPRGIFASSCVPCARNLLSVQMWEAVKASASQRQVVSITVSPSCHPRVSCSYARLSSSRRCCHCQLMLVDRAHMQSQARPVARYFCGDCCFYTFIESVPARPACIEQIAFTYRWTCFSLCGFFCTAPVGVYAAPRVVIHASIEKTRPGCASLEVRGVVCPLLLLCGCVFFFTLAAACCAAAAAAWHDVLARRFVFFCFRT